MSITFLIPTRFRYDDLMDSLNEIYSKALNKDKIFTIVTVYNDDEITINNIENIKNINKNITVLINKDLSLGYIDMDKLWDKMANLVKTDLLALWTDRIRILTNNWDKLLFDFYNKNKHVYMIIRVKEIGTWNWAYPIVTSELHKLIGIFKSTAIDAYIRYIAEYTNIELFLKTIEIERIPQKELKSKYLTPYKVKVQKEHLFRREESVKNTLRNDINKIVNDKQYIKISNHTINEKWLKNPLIGNGKTIIGERLPPTILKSWCEKEKVTIEREQIVKSAWYGTDIAYGMKVPIEKIHHNMIVSKEILEVESVCNKRNKLFLEVIY